MNVSGSILMKKMVRSRYPWPLCWMDLDYNFTKLEVQSIAGKQIKIACGMLFDIYIFLRREQRV